jgi:hypothetical protein
MVCIKNGWLFLKDWIPGQARDDTVYGLVGLVSGNLSTIPPLHLSTFKDPVIRVLFPSHGHHSATTSRHHEGNHSTFLQYSKQKSGKSSLTYLK